MSLLTWFSRKSDPRPASGQSDSGGLRDQRAKPQAARDKSTAPTARPEADPVNRSETRKAKRHARREQLFVAVREAMTRGGVLASSYKFKVLSLDQRGDQFLVMMDVAPAVGRDPEKLAETEGLIVQTAMARFDILVTSVYWRIEAAAGDGLTRAGTAPAAKKAPPPRYEPIQEDEVTAFKQALAAASATSHTTVDATGKSRSGMHSYTLLTGFEDTEMPESGAAPALSTTQYGDLN
ncbi:MAG: hypothetical protein JWQ72_2453 [Polaromonas sp.]|nr:hypothetical protein [Polaromonas sp.]